MNATPSLLRCVRYAFAVSSLSLFGGVVLGEAAPGPAPKRDAKGAAKRMVEAIANRNKPPKLVDRTRAWPRRLPLYPEGYDWKEEERVRDALDKLYQEATAELWEELVRREGDERYCVTVVDNAEDAHVHSVGLVCWYLAYSRLVGVFEQHLPPNRLRVGARIPLDAHAIVPAKTLAEWRKARAKKSLYQLQIEVCENALRELAKVKRVSEKEKADARRKIEAEIRKLKAEKKPVFLKHASFRETQDALYTPGLAARIRKVIRSGSSETIGIIK
jgi:hypothetical protein